MSQWTHVNGIVRIDTMRYDLYIGGLTPWGSEGPLNVVVWQSPAPNSIAKFTVSIFGDLRDYNNEEEVVAFFENLATMDGFWIRSGVFEVEVEGLEPSIYQFNGEKFVKVFPASPPQTRRTKCSETDQTL